MFLTAVNLPTYNNTVLFIKLYFLYSSNDFGSAFFNEVINNVSSCIIGK